MRGDLDAGLSTEARHAFLEASFELQTLVMSPSDFLDLQVLHVHIPLPSISRFHSGGNSVLMCKHRKTF